MFAPFSTTDQNARFGPAFYNTEVLRLRTQ